MSERHECLSKKREPFWEIIGIQILGLSAIDTGMYREDEVTAGEEKNYICPDQIKSKTFLSTSVMIIFTCLNYHRRFHECIDSAGWTSHLVRN